MNGGAHILPTISWGWGPAINKVALSPRQGCRCPGDICTLLMVEGYSHGSKRTPPRPRAVPLPGKCRGG